MLYRAPAAEPSARALRLKKIALFVLVLTGLLLPCAQGLALPRVPSRAQVFERELDAAGPVELRVKNRTGRVTVVAEDGLKQVSIRATSAAALAVGERDVRVSQTGGTVTIEVEREQATARPSDGRKVTSSAAQVERERIDLTVRVPSRSRVFVETEAGAVDVVGNVAEAEAKTDTGTIRADVPLDALRYSFRWTLSRPRVFSEVELPAFKSKRGGVFEIAGRFGEKRSEDKKLEKRDGKKSKEESRNEKNRKKESRREANGENKENATSGKNDTNGENGANGESEEGRKDEGEKLKEKQALKDARIRLDLETARGVVLFGVKDESHVPSDLRERTLTEAARAVIRSGDTELIDAIRTVAPRLVGEYAETLPPRGGEPTLSARTNPLDVARPAGANLARVQARVTDRGGRAVAGLTAGDFSVTEGGVARAVREVAPTSAPFNLVLLLDVSGSLEERIDFIRKAALAFLNTAGPQDRIAIVSFRDDVQLVSDFTSDRRVLSERIKDIQAGGATALYDALGYSLVSILKPLRGERTGIVVLSDGDDNRSFLTFPSIVDAIYETGAIVYPLYVPSGLIPESGAGDSSAAALDPVRTRFLELTSRADAEGRRLAEVSGGTYYPITRLEQLQRAYDDVAAQLRTAYTITYESGAEPRTDSRVRVRVARDGASVRLSPAVGVAAATAPTP
ncbi:MAG: Ca-activated chloride channel [Acidobacteriota bacterium]|nr:Ca-activated chloride channel [Acidobacteriota bacterium]